MWREIARLVEEKTNPKIQFIETIILFGVTRKEVPTSLSNLKFINYLILIGKMCISKVKFGKFKNIHLVLEKELELRKHLQLQT